MRLEEEEEATETAKTVKEESKRVFKVGEYDVEEVYSEDSDVSYLKCIKCGFKVPITEAVKIKEHRCGGQGVCHLCGRTSQVHDYPVWDAVIKEFKDQPLCLDCERSYENFFLSARPTVAKLRHGVGIVRAVHPLEKRHDTKVAWFSDFSTFFVRVGEAWICPACEDKHYRLGDVAKHFSQRHPLEASRGLTVAWLPSVGEYAASWQGV
ncbi:MAG: hypothetical protein F7C82_06275 [Desulfurococcales archaeon]|nr:hypothetical protein [Desulfurococcales archaeon]